MPNTSASGGFLVPDGVLPAILEDDALDDFFGDLVAGVTGLDRDAAVRPRWQQEPPDLPGVGTDWVAVGVKDDDPDAFATVVHDGNAAGGTGADILTMHEKLEVFCSFYGPNARANANRLRTGLMIAQNREPLQLASMGLVAVDKPIRAPELVKNLWLNRIDVSVWIKREIQTEFAVRSLLSAAATIVTERTLNLVAAATTDVPQGSELDFSEPDNSELLPGI